MVSLLYKKEYPINEKIKIVIPSVGEIIDHEEDYYAAVTALTAMPIDIMAQLDDIGIDFTEITEYELFLLMFNGVAQSPCASLIFGDLDLTKFRVAVDEQNGLTVLIDPENDIKIDEAIYSQIALVLRTIHGLKKDIRKPGNDEAKKYMLERARLKIKRNSRRNRQSQIEPLIIAMVNTEQFKYDFNSVKDMTIYQFNESVKQVVKKIDYDNKMHGVYAGTVSVKDLKQEDLNWLSNK